MPVGVRPRQYRFKSGTNIARAVQPGAMELCALAGAIALGPGTAFGSVAAANRHRDHHAARGEMARDRGERALAELHPPGCIARAAMGQHQYRERSRTHRPVDVDGDLPVTDVRL